MRIKIISVLLCMMLLQACASPKHAEELQQGKIYFERGDFKPAFHQLLPVAAAGNKQAEYAVGYMYFYGYGVAQDEESGLFWMQKSAEQHYAPAIKALEIVHKPKVKPLDDDAPIKPTIEKPLRPSLPTSKKQIRAEGYGLQLLGAYDLEVVKKAQTKLNLPQSTAIWHAEHNGKDWYVLVYGHYDSIMNAKLAMDQLPASVKNMGPWVRSLSGLG